MGALYINMCTQPTSAVYLFTAKSEKIFQDAIALVILTKIDLHLLKVALILLSKILLPCVDYFIKGIKKLVPHSESVRSTFLWLVLL